MHLTEGVGGGRCGTWAISSVAAPSWDDASLCGPPARGQLGRAAGRGRGGGKGGAGEGEGKQKREGLRGTCARSVTHALQRGRIQSAAPRGHAGSSEDTAAAACALRAAGRPRLSRRRTRPWGSETSRDPAAGAPPPRCPRPTRPPRLPAAALGAVRSSADGCGVVGRRQLRAGGRLGGCSSGAPCWEGRRRCRGCPPSPQYSPYLIRCPGGQLGGCKQAAGVGLQLRGSVLGGNEAPRGLPSFSSALPIPHPWGSCGAVGQAWGCSSGARCWGGSPPLQCSPYLIHIPWGSCGAAGRRQLWVGGQVWGCSPPPCCTQTQCWGALRGLPSFSSVLHTASMSHGAAAGLQAGSSCRLGGRCGAAAPRCTQGLIVGAH